MASLTIPSYPRTTSATSARRWPATSRWRNSLRIGLAAPYVVLALLSQRNGYRSTANANLKHASQSIRWGSSDLSFIAHVSPPLPVALAGVLPGLLSLSILGALAAGVVLEALGARLSQSRIPLPIVVLVTLGFGCTPGFAYSALTDLRSFMALTLLAVAIDGFLRFALKAETHGGFQAGLALGMASLCDPVAIVCAAGFAAAAPLIARSRFQGQHSIGRATAAVLLFPTIAGVCGWSFLCWRFSGSAFGWFRTEEPTFGFGSGMSNQLGLALRALQRPLLLTPIYLLALALLLIRRQIITAAAITLPLFCVVFSEWVGLRFTSLSLALLLGVVGVASLPRRPARSARVLIVFVALAGPALKWIYVSSPDVVLWQHSLR